MLFAKEKSELRSGFFLCTQFSSSDLQVSSLRTHSHVTIGIFAESYLGETERFINTYLLLKCNMNRRVTNHLGEFEYQTTPLELFVEELTREWRVKLSDLQPPSDFNVIAPHYDIMN